MVFGVHSRDLMKGVGLLSTVVVLGATFGLAQVAAASPRGGARLIDTDRVIGNPQTVKARPGHGTAAPAITAQPANETVAAGANASFSASASGTPAPTVRWQDSTNGGRTWRNITSATSTTLSFTATSSENGEQYRAVFTNSAGSATTAASTLTVASTPPPPSGPAITAQPASATVTAGAIASFSAAASGSPTPTDQWLVSTGGGAFAPISGATSTTLSFTTSTSENGNQYEAVFTNSAGSATTNAGTLTVTAAPPPPPSQSSNWSGYANTGATFSAASGSWTVPTISCKSGTTAYSAQWIGIDGFSSSTVEQDGTEADCLNGSPSYDAWYEMFGDSVVNNGNEVELSPSTNPVSPGDAMSASVNVAGSTWTLAISNASPTHGWTFTTNIVFSAARSSAEWIVERPEICSRSCSLTSLADFGSVTFSNAVTTSTTGTSEPVSANTETAMEMVNGSTVLAVPGALTTNGEGFTDTWEAS